MITINKKGLLYHYLNVYCFCTDLSRYNLKSTLPTTVCSLILQMISGVFVIISLITAVVISIICFTFPCALIMLSFVYDVSVLSLFDDNWDFVLFAIGLLIWYCVFCMLYEKFRYRTGHIPCFNKINKTIDNNIVPFFNKIKCFFGEIAYADDGKPL